ncbi:hypothetical protein ACROYT_G025722 [Oculina patagonica]
MSSGGLTEEQRKRIEENRRKALEKRAALLSQRQQKNAPTATSSATDRCDAGKFASSHAVKSSRENKSFLSSSRDKTSVPQRQPSSKSEGDNSSLNLQSTNQTSNSYMYTNGHAKPHLVGSASTSVGSSTSVSNSMAGTASLNSFQSTISKFYRPQNAPSSSTRKLETKPNSSWSTTSNSTSVSASNSAGSSKSNAAFNLNVRGKSEKPVKGNCVLISRQRFTVVVPYQPQLIGIFKTIPSRSYDAKTFQWDFSLTDYDKLMQAVQSLPSHITVEGLPKAVMSTFLKTTPGTLKKMSTSEINLNSVDHKLVGALMQFQQEGVSFSIRHDGRVLIADDMGLGKTIQAICVACYYRTEWPVLIITPSSLRITWQQAFIKWLPSVDPEYINVVLTGKDNPTAGLINIISYDLLSKCMEDIKKKQFRVIIADECHFIKNYKASRTQAALPLLKAATRVILLSGTPALSRPLELYTQICAIQPGLFPTFHQFGIRYCAGQQNRFGWDFSGASNMQELQLLLEEKLMIRRLKKDVLSQLPSKRRQMVMLDPSLIKTKTLERAAKEVSKAKQQEQHGALLNYFFETCACKVPAVRDYILDLLESGRKFLVFAHHKSMLDAICNCLTQKKYDFIRIDGSTPAGIRQSLCDKFQQNKECLVAALSITAANTGLTLTEASAVVFAELFWNPGALVQAEDRVYRIGQKNAVNIHYLVAKKTADDYLWPLIQNKLEVLGKAGLSEDVLEADCTFFKDPKQQTLFSFVESFVEDYATDNSSKSVETVPSTSCNNNPSLETDAKVVTMKTKKSKDGYFASGSDTRKRTKPKGEASETGSDFAGAIDDNFDWFDGLTDDDIITDGLQDDITRCNDGQFNSEPSAKRSRR